VGTARALIVLGAGAPFEDDVDRATAKFQKSLNISQDLEDAEGIVLSLLWDTRRTCGETKHSNRLLDERSLREGMARGKDDDTRARSHKGDEQ